MNFRFRVLGVEDNTVSRRRFDVPVDEFFDIDADCVGDALNELVNRSGMWEAIDARRDFTIEYVPVDDDPPGSESTACPGDA